MLRYLISSARLREFRLLDSVVLDLIFDSAAMADFICSSRLQLLEFRLRDSVGVSDAGCLTRLQSLEF